MPPDVVVSLSDTIEHDEVLALYVANRWSSAEKPELRGSTVTSKFRPFLEGLSSAGAGLRAATVKVLWWHVCNSHPQT